MEQEKKKKEAREYMTLIIVQVRKLVETDKNITAMFMFIHLPYTQRRV